MNDPVSNPDPKTRRAPRWMKITLVVSLAANLLVVGALAGAALNHQGKPQARKDGARGAIANVITDALPKEERRALGREVRRALRSEPEYQESLRAEIMALVDLMQAPDYTAAALEGQLIEIQSQMMGPISVARAALVAHLSSLDAAKRTAYSVRLEELLQDMRP
ncbi:MAG: periplasmic heavy metal sensor [Pseudomonadota bacterium]